MKLIEQHQQEITEFIKMLGGPMCAIEHILIETGPLYSENKRAVEYITAVLNYIASIRHLNTEATNRLIKPYNLFFQNNSFIILPI